MSGENCTRFPQRDNTLLQMQIVINNIINIFHDKI